MERYAYYSQAHQALAYKVQTEHYRRFVTPIKSPVIQVSREVDGGWAGKYNVCSVLAVERRLGSSDLVVGGFQSPMEDGSL